MNIDPQEIHTFRVQFEAGNLVPPPYHYTYTLEVKLSEPDTPAKYEIRYLHREALSEDEILDEGFTLDDDWRWEGKLPANWRKALQEQIKKQSWPKKPEKPQEDEAALTISLIGADEKQLFSGLPADIKSWEYFLQELIQAILEIGDREAPFQLVYREVKSGNEQYQIELEASFAERVIRAWEIRGNDSGPEVKAEWQKLKNLMKNIYIPDYDYDKASVQEPKKRGKYLYTGEGLWFKFGDSLTEPDKNSNSLERLEKSLKELFE